MEYQLIDADERYYEPDDCLTRHIEARFRDETVRVRRDGDGLGWVFVRGRRTFMSVMPGDYAFAPGALEGLFAGEVADGFTHREVINARDYPAFTGKRARLALMDERGVLGGQLPSRPSEALARHLWVCPFPEDDVTELIGAIGADHVLFGSDYPHPEGLREPRDFAGLLGLPDHTPALAG